MDYLINKKANYNYILELETEIKLLNKKIEDKTKRCENAVNSWITISKKLEAVKKWCEYHRIPNTAGATRKSLKDLFKILGVKE